MRMLRRLLESKKGESASTESSPEYMLYFAALAVIIGLFAVFLVIGISSYQSSTTTVIGNLKYTIAQYRLLHSPECFAYQDKDTKRTYPMTIDISRFTYEKLYGCMKGTIMNNLCLDLELKDPTGKSIDHIKTIDYRSPAKVAVDVWAVNVLDKDKLYPAMLTVKQGDPC